MKHLQRMRCQKGDHLTGDEASCLPEEAPAGAVTVKHEPDGKRDDTPHNPAHTQALGNASTGGPREQPNQRSDAQQKKRENGQTITEQKTRAPRGRSLARIALRGMNSWTANSKRAKTHHTATNIARSERTICGLRQITPMRSIRLVSQPGTAVNCWLRRFLDVLITRAFDTFKINQNTQCKVKLSDH
jgi:hypothetical protein